MGDWACALEPRAESIDLPLIERGVEIETADRGDAAITIRPRSTNARVELRPFEKLAADRLVWAEDAARRCLATIEDNDGEGVSPFKAETFEPILKVCGSQLDPEGRYLPDHRQLAATETVGEFGSAGHRGSKESPRAERWQAAGA